MAYEEKKPAEQTSHRLTLDERQTLWVSGVEEVESFDEELVAVRTSKGLLLVRGVSLKVDKLEKTSGELTVSGTVTGLDYADDGPKGGFWARLLH